jgi:hypothetical protein
MSDANNDPADKWAALGHEAIKAAFVATTSGHHGTAAENRKTADECFAKELALRQLAKEGTP